MKQKILAWTNLIILVVIVVVLIIGLSMDSPDPATLW